MNDWNAKIIEEFRANEGRVGGNFEGAPLLLLHSTGAKSGQERVHPMLYLAVDDGFARRIQPPRAAHELERGEGSFDARSVTQGHAPRDIRG